MLKNQTLLFNIGDVLVSDDTDEYYTITGVLKATSASEEHLYTLSDDQSYEVRRVWENNVLKQFTIVKSNPKVKPGVEDFQNQIDEVMDNMDFGRIAKVMDVLNWEWADIGGVPQEHEIRSNARSIMRQCINSEYNYLKTGGFIARIEDGILTLSFSVEDWSAE